MNKMVMKVCVAYNTFHFAHSIICNYGNRDLVYSLFAGILENVIFRSDCNYFKKKSLKEIKKNFTKPSIKNKY